MIIKFSLDQFTILLPTIGSGYLVIRWTFDIIVKQEKIQLKQGIQLNFLKAKILKIGIIWIILVRKAYSSSSVKVINASMKLEMNPKVQKQFGI